MNTIQWFIDGNPALLILDAAGCHWTPEVRARLEQLNIHKCCIPKSLTWRFQCIDVIVVALWKSALYGLWSKWMLEAIKSSHYMEASWNYIAPSRTQVIKWIMEAWDGPASKVTTAAIIKGSKLCYMSEDLDDAMAPWDHCKDTADYEKYDWEAEVSKLTDKQKNDLFISPLGVKAEKENESEDEEEDSIYEEPVFGEF